MREIKFRAWDRERKRMLYFSDVWFCDEYNLLTFELDRTPFGDEYIDFDLEDNAPIMQYIGLKDNTKWEQLTRQEQQDWLDSGKKKEKWNGKEIYEGDIVETDEDCLGIVEFNMGMFEVRYLRNVNDVTNPAVIAARVTIGNIYENPELLKEEG